MRFEDVITLDTKGRLNINHEIEEQFLHVCEPDSIEVIGYSTSSPCLCGIQVDKNILNITFSGSIPQKVTVKISGIRKGRLGNRFPIFTKEEMNKNTQFWGSWRKD